MMPLLNNMSLSHPGTRWAMVYTMEAHAVDEWPISSARYEPSGAPVCIPQHKTLEERLAAARTFQETFSVPFPVCVDLMDNRFESLFCTWPFRVYILQEGKVVWRADPKACSYQLEDLVCALERLAPQAL